jgi:hypothetical protein
LATRDAQPHLLCSSITGQQINPLPSQIAAASPYPQTCKSEINLLHKTKPVSFQSPHQQQQAPKNKITSPCLQSAPLPQSKTEPPANHKTSPFKTHNPNSINITTMPNPRPLPANTNPKFQLIKSLNHPSIIKSPSSITIPTASKPQTRTHSINHLAKTQNHSTSLRSQAHCPDLNSLLLLTASSTPPRLASARFQLMLPSRASRIHEGRTARKKRRRNKSAKGRKTEK